MPTTMVSEGRRLHGAGNGHGGNGHGGHDASAAKRVVEDDSTLVLQEIMRLVDASKEGRLSERGKATLFNGVHREMIQGVNEMLDAILLPIGEGNRVLAQISAGKIDELITHLQGRPRKDEGGRQQRGDCDCRACRRKWRG